MGQMKDSGIEWIGEIPAEWEISKIKKLFFIGRGRVIATTELQDSGYPVYSSQTKNNGILGYIPTYDFDCSQLTWTTDGANAGTVFLRQGKHNCTNVCGTLCPRDNKNDLHYLQYTLEHISKYHKRADINGFKIMNNEMADIEMILPSLPEQQRIAAYLDAKCGEIDKVMSKTCESIAEYKKLKQSIITEAVTNPKWEVVKLKYLVTILDEYRKPVAAEERTHNSEVLYDYYGASGKIDKIDGYTIDDHILLIGEDGANLLMRHLPLVYEVNGKAWINNHAHILKPNDGVNFYFVKYALESKDISVFVTGSAQPKLSQDNLKVITLMVPTLSEQQRIVAYLDKKCSEIDNLIARKEQLLTELEKYKKSLIYECVTGKREVG